MLKKYRLNTGLVTSTSTIEASQDIVIDHLKSDLYLFGKMNLFFKSFNFSSIDQQFNDDTVSRIQVLIDSITSDSDEINKIVENDEKYARLEMMY